MPKKNLAVLGVGIIGTGSMGEGIPAMVSGLIELQEKYSITIYSFIPIQKDKVPKGIRARCVRGHRFLKIRFMGLVFQFMLDHLLKKFDLIHAQSPYAAGVMSFWLNRLFKIPWLLSLHATETVSEIPFGDLLNPRLKKAALQVCQKANLLMVMSNYQAEITRNNLKLDRPIIVLPRGIKSASFTNKSLTHPIKFLHISNYNPIKDYDTLFKTFEILSHQLPSELVIVGSNYDANVREVAGALVPGKIKFLGAISNDQLKEQFAEAHILLHTSKYESLAMTALEAMAHGVVVCGTHVGVLADLSGKYCLTVPPGKFDLLAERVIEILKDERSYQQLRFGAYEWVKARDLKWYVSELDNLYLKLLQK